MSNAPIQSETRFPWLYSIFAFAPIGLIVVCITIATVLGPSDGMGPALFGTLLVGPIGIVIAIWGGILIWRDRRGTYPALRWLVWIPAILGMSCLVLT